LTFLLVLSNSFFLFSNSNGKIRTHDFANATTVAFFRVTDLWQRVSLGADGGRDFQDLFGAALHTDKTTLAVIRIDENLSHDFLCVHFLMMASYFSVHSGRGVSQNSPTGILLLPSAFLMGTVIVLKARIISTGVCFLCTGHWDKISMKAAPFLHMAFLMALMV
jgi:hypothetical protein